MNDEEKAKKCRNAEYNEDKKNDDKKDSTEVNDESDNGKNATKEVHTDESDEKTKVDAENLYKKEFENVHIVGNNWQPNLI